jgi:hypothetical protein
VDARPCMFGKDGKMLMGRRLGEHRLRESVTVLQWLQEVIQRQRSRPHFPIEGFHLHDPVWPHVQIQKRRFLGADVALHPRGQRVRPPPPKTFLPRSRIQISKGSPVVEDRASIPDLTGCNASKPTPLTLIMRPKRLSDCRGGKIGTETKLTGRRDVYARLEKLPEHRHP